MQAVDAALRRTALSARVAHRSGRLPISAGARRVEADGGRVPVNGVIDDLGQIGGRSDRRTQLGILARAAWPMQPPPDGHALTVEVWRLYGAPMRITYDLLRRWDAYRDAMSTFGETYDVTLSPVFPTPAPLHGVLASEPDRTHYTNPHNLTGWPAATVRAGPAPAGCRSACNSPRDRGRTRRRSRRRPRSNAHSAGTAHLRYVRGRDRAPRRTRAVGGVADRPLARAADPLPRGHPAHVRRRVQRDLPGVQDAAGDRVAPGRDPGALRRARAPHAAGPGRSR